MNRRLAETFTLCCVFQWSNSFLNSYDFLGVGACILTARKEAEISVVDHCMVGLIVAIQRSLSLSDIRYLTDIHSYHGDTVVRYEIGIKMGLPWK